MRSITPAQSTSCCWSLSATPRSIARPSTAGITAWHDIHTMPNAMPPARVGSCCRASHQRNRSGERWSGVPGSATGSVLTGPILGSATGGDESFSVEQGRHDEVGRPVLEVPSVAQHRVLPAGDQDVLDVGPAGQARTKSADRAGGAIRSSVPCTTSTRRPRRSTRSVGSTHGFSATTQRTCGSSPARSAARPPSEWPTSATGRSPCRSRDLLDRPPRVHHRRRPRVPPAVGVEEPVHGEPRLPGPRDAARHGDHPEHRQLGGADHHALAPARAAVQHDDDALGGVGRADGDQAGAGHGVRPVPGTPRSMPVRSRSSASHRSMASGTGSGSGISRTISRTMPRNDGTRSPTRT